MAAVEEMEQHFALKAIEKPEDKLKAVCLLLRESVAEKQAIQEALSKQVTTREVQNKLVTALRTQIDLTKEESELKLKEETDKRVAIINAFESTVAELSTLVESHTGHNRDLRQENEQMRKNLGDILAQCDAREKAVTAKCTEYELQLKLLEAKLAKSKIERAELNADFTKERLDMHKAMLTSQCEKDEAIAASTELKEQLEVYRKQYEELERGMSGSSKNFDTFRTEMERLGKKLRSVERDTQEWKQKFDDSNDQVKKMNQMSLEREDELKAVKKKLAAMEKLNRALQKERAELMETAANHK